MSSISPQPSLELPPTFPRPSSELDVGRYETHPGSPIVRVASSSSPLERVINPKNSKKTKSLWEKTVEQISSIENTLSEMMERALVLTGKGLYFLGGIMVVYGGVSALFTITTTFSTKELARNNCILPLLFGSVFLTLGRKLKKRENPTEDAIGNLFWSGLVDRFSLN